MSELDLAAIRARADRATPAPWKLWGMSVLADPVGDSNLDTAILVANTTFRDAQGRPRTNDADFIAAARSDVPALLAEVERLTRIVNGYARTPAEQRAAEAEAEVERLRADVKMLRDANYKRRHRSDGMQVIQAVIPVRELLGCADDAPSPVHPRDPADCPVCRHALGLPESATLVLSPETWCDVCGAWHIPASCSAANAPSEASAAPVAANGAGMAHGDTPQADDAGEGQS